MATFEQAKYCPNCKKNVSADKNDKCSICGGKIQRGVWSVRFRIQEYQGSKHKRLSGFQTKKEAQQGYIDFIANYHPFTELNKHQLIFDDALNEYLRTCNVNNKNSTIYEKERVFENFITPYFTGKDLFLITKADLFNWQANLCSLKNPFTKQPYSSKYVSKIRTTFYNFLSYCETLYNVQNHFKSIKRPKDKDMEKDIEFWEVETFNKFISTIDDILWRTLWYTFMYTGARFNEIRALSDADIKDNKITINKAITSKKSKQTSVLVESTKNYRKVKKNIPKILIDIIDEYKAWKKKEKISSTFLFGGDIPLAENTIRRKLEEQIKNAKVTPITPHGFRHSYVSLLIHLGVSTKVIAELIGDKEEQVLKTYGHLYSNAKDLAIDLIDNM